MSAEAEAKSYCYRPVASPSSIATQMSSRPWNSSANTRLLQFHAYMKYTNTMEVSISSWKRWRAATSKFITGACHRRRSRNFGLELADYLSQLRSLQPPDAGFIGSLSLSSSLDHRLSRTRFGPFQSVADFHTYLRRGRPLEHWADEPDVVQVHSKPENYSVKFSHADLNPTNIMVKDGHITAIIDWEFAGWYPEYWDYTKMYWSERHLWAKFYHAVEEQPGIQKYPYANHGPSGL